METTPSTTNSPEILRSERIAAGILPKVLNSFDMVAIFVALVLLITNAPGIASAGGVAYIYWALGFITFLIPGAIVTGQLGLMFPGEGSIYVWTHKAFGRFMGFFAGFCAWWPGIIAMISVSVGAVTSIQHLGSLFGANLLSDSWQQGLVILCLLAVSLMLSVLRFRVTQNIVNTVFVVYGGAVLLVGIAGLLWLLGGHPSQTNLASADTWQITFGGTGNFTIFGFVILALLGIEVPLNMGVEIRDTRAITRYLLWGAVVVIVAYLLATFSVMAVVPVKDQANTTAVAEAIQVGFGPAGTILAALFDVILVGVFVLITTVYNYSFGRLLFVSGLDQQLPVVMSKVNANKVPWVAVVVQTIIAAVFTVVIFIVGPLTVKVSNLSTLMYYITLASTAVIWLLSMVILFIDVIFIRAKYQEVFARIQLAPTWVFYVCAILGLVSSAVGIYATFTAPWVPLILTTGWDAWIGSIVVVSLLVGVVVFLIGRRNVSTSVSDEDVIAEAVS